MDREYTFYEYTQSLCNECLKTIPAKIVFKNDSVYVLKRCQEHGEMLELLEEDINYHIKKRNFDKPGTSSKIQTDIVNGCPYDCGLCEDHDQHSCIGLIEITKNCDLMCPVCYAEADSGNYLDMDTIEKMMDLYQDAEYNKAEILQISGGEPTTHPDILKIISLAKEKKFKYVMLNTNGIRIAEDEEFVKELANFIGGFEIYLQFDGFKESTYSNLRGKNLADIKRKAIDNLTKYKIPITLVTTISRGINDDELGEIVQYGLSTKYVRGINFQPVAYFGRYDKADTENRITISGIINEIEKQTNKMLRKDDFIPLPCNVERIATTYLYREGNSFIPITRNVDISKYTHLINNTFAFNVEETLKLTDITTAFGCNCFNFLKDIRKLVPLNLAFKTKEEKIKYVDENTFRISITSFVDKYNFDMKSIKKECVHIITEDLRRVPFSSYNMIHRKV